MELYLSQANVRLFRVKCVYCPYLRVEDVKIYGVLNQLSGKFQGKLRSFSHDRTYRN